MHDSARTSRELPPVDDLDAVADLVFRSGAAFDRYTSQLRRVLGLNAHERLAVSSLWANGPQSMSELGRVIPLSRAAVTTLVDRLERDGLVERSPHPSDRRQVIVSLDPSVLARTRPVMEPWGVAMAALLSSRSDQEWATIASFLLDLTELNEREARALAARSDADLGAFELTDSR